MIKAKRKFLKKWEYYKYKLESNEKLVEAYTSIERSIDNLRNNEFFNHELMKNTISYRDLSNENTAKTKSVWEITSKERANKNFKVKSKSPFSTNCDFSKIKEEDFITKPLIKGKVDGAFRSKIILNLILI